jgi:hypothetical protein
VSGFGNADTATLELIQANLRAGLGLVADRIAAGRFDEIGAKGNAPPSQSGQTTRWLHQAITEELERRNDHAADRPV